MKRIIQLVVSIFLTFGFAYLYDVTIYKTVSCMGAMCGFVATFVFYMIYMNENTKL